MLLQGGLGEVAALRRGPSEDGGLPVSEPSSGAWTEVTLIEPCPMCSSLFLHVYS